MAEKATEKKVKQADTVIESAEKATEDARPSGIIVKDPETFRPKTLPLIVVLPEDASKAQIERAKVLNAYAYQFPEKWAERKEKLIKELEDLKNAPDPVENGDVKLTIGTKAPTL